MRNNNIHKKHLRGSSILQKEVPGKSVLETWVRGLRSIRENPKDSLRGGRREGLTAQENDTGSQSDNERWQDDGGESGEEL